MRSSNKSARHRPFEYQRLEGRRLLAGNVQVAIEGSTLVITGDQLANQIEVSQAATGDVVFTGRDSTTINGLDEFTSSQTFARTRFELNDGADEVTLNGFEAGREFRFLGGSGNDRLIANSVTARYFHVQGNAGDDAIQLVQSSSRRSSYFHLGEGDDVAAVVSFSAGHNFKVYGDSGNDTYTSNELSVRRKFRLSLGNGNDQALISGDTSVGRSAKFRLGSGSDFLGVLPDLSDATAVFNRQTFVNAGSGDDAVALGDSNRFERIVKVKGQSGDDSIDLGESDFEGRSIIRRFENQNVGNIDELLDQVFETLEDVGFDSAQFGNDVDSAESSIETELPEADISFVENDEAIAVFNDLELEANPTENIASVIIEIQAGDTNDLLTFENQNGIVGSFDSAENTLTLTGVASASEYQAAVRSILFESPGDTPLAGSRTLELSIQSELPFAPIAVARAIEVVATDDPVNLVLPGAIGETTQQALNQSFDFDFEDADPDNTVVYQLDLEDSGISAGSSQPTINPETGEFTWTPSEIGTFLLRVIATNDLGESDQEEFSVVVEDRDFAITEIQDQTLNFNESLEIPVEALGITLDPAEPFQLEVSGDAVEATDNLPVISNNGLITWTPDLLTSGTAIITVRATGENLETASETFEVTLLGFEPFQGNGQLASIAPAERNSIYGDSFQGDGPPLTIDQSLDYTATISTEVGDITVDLFADLTPLSVNNFVNLAEDGFYDGLSFHRVVESPVPDADGNTLFERFVAQAGDPTNTSSGGPGYRINDEILSELTFDRPGILAYAKTSAPNTNGSQFFITYDATSFQNDENFTIFGEVNDFGEVINGQNALDRLNLTNPSSNNPATPTIIESISIVAS